MKLVSRLALGVGAVLLAVAFFFGIVFGPNELGPTSVDWGGLLIIVGLVLGFLSGRSANRNSN